MCTSVQCSRERIHVNYMYQTPKFNGAEGEMLGQLVVTPEVQLLKLTI